MKLGVQFLESAIRCSPMIIGVKSIVFTSARERRLR
jgi:hypothetical protein